MKFYYSYTVDMNGVKVFTPGPLSNKYFMITSKIGYATQFLCTTADTIETAAVSFTSICECYDTTHNTQIERQRLEEAYFIQRSILITNAPTRVPERDDNDRVDLESLCKEVMEELPKEDPYARHACTTDGCREGFMMADSIEKVCR